MVLMANRYIMPAALEYLTSRAERRRCQKRRRIDNARQKLLGKYWRLVDRFKTKRIARIATRSQWRFRRKHANACATGDSRHGRAARARRSD